MQTQSRSGWKVVPVLVGLALFAGCGVTPADLSTDESLDELKGKTCEKLKEKGCNNHPNQCNAVYTYSCPACPPNVACAPCSGQFERCESKPPPSKCAGLDEKTCSVTAGCYPNKAVCAALCLPNPNGDAGCAPCPDAYLGCEPLPPPPPPNPCQGLSELTCPQTPGCQLVPEPCPAYACAVLADGGVSCPICEKKLTCQPAPPPPPPNTCENLDRKTCGATTGCQVVEWACAAVCELLPDGGCKPCLGGFSCVPSGPVPPLPPPTDPCVALDAKTCTLDARCTVTPGPCPVCTPDGYCPPCGAPICISK
jgi:hypothetical protein